MATDDWPIRDSNEENSPVLGQTCLQSFSQMGGLRPVLRDQGKKAVGATIPPGHELFRAVEIQYLSRRIKLNKL